MAGVYQKDPADVLDYVFDWSAWLGVGETISTSIVTVASGLTKDSNTNTSTAVTVWLSGGTAGTSYKVANKITTNQARTVEKTIIIQVDER